MILNKNHKNTTQFSWATPYAAKSCLPECSSKFGMSVFQDLPALLTKQENFVEKPSLRLKKPFPVLLPKMIQVLWGSRYACGMTYFLLFRDNSYHQNEDFRPEDKKWFFKRNALGFSTRCMNLKEVLGGLYWAWKVYFSEPNISQTALGQSPYATKWGFLGFC